MRFFTCGGGGGKGEGGVVEGGQNYVTNEQFHKTKTVLYCHDMAVQSYWHQ